MQPAGADAMSCTRGPVVRRGAHGEVCDTSTRLPFRLPHSCSPRPPRSPACSWRVRRPLRCRAPAARLCHAPGGGAPPGVERAATPTVTPPCEVLRPHARGRRPVPAPGLTFTAATHAERRVGALWPRLTAPAPPLLAREHHRTGHLHMRGQQQCDPVCGTERRVLVHRRLGLGDQRRMGVCSHGQCDRLLHVHGRAVRRRRLRLHAGVPEHRPVRHAAVQPGAAVGAAGAVCGWQQQRPGRHPPAGGHQPAPADAAGH